MVYIFTEDSTSGYDFINNIVRLVNPTLQFKIDTANGCSSILNLLNKYNICSGDKIIMYFDFSTFDIKKFDSWFRRKQNVLVYFQNFYCFESVFYSYKRFTSSEINFGNNHTIFMDFANVLRFPNDAQKLNNFKYKYNITSVNTVEQYANSVFSQCTYSEMPCVHVSKYKYQSLAMCANSPDSRFKCFYNNCCNRFTISDIYKHQRGELGYCEHRKSITPVHCSYNSTTVHNLIDLYNNTVLCKPLKLYKAGGVFYLSNVYLHTIV